MTSIVVLFEGRMPIRHTKHKFILLKYFSTFRCYVLQQLDMWKPGTMLHCQVTIYYLLSTLIYYLVSFTAPQTLTKSHNMFLLPRPAQAAAHMSGKITRSAAMRVLGCWHWWHIVARTLRLDKGHVLAEPRWLAGQSQYF